LTPSINERRQLDRLQLAALAALMFIGAAFVFSATMVNQSAALPWYDQIWIRQIIWYALGLGAARGALPRGLSHAGALVARGVIGRRFSPGRVLIPHIGRCTAGARRWIDLGRSNFSRANLRSSRSFSRRQIFEPSAG
jgi:cell division protein FtsW (lipid II flippase)